MGLQVQMINNSVNDLSPEYGIYNKPCPYCGINLHMDYELKKGVRKYRFKCLKCRKEIAIEKGENNGSGTVVDNDPREPDEAGTESFEGPSVIGGP